MQIWTKLSIKHLRTIKCNSRLYHFFNTDIFIQPSFFCYYIFILYTWNI